MARGFMIAHSSAPPPRQRGVPPPLRFLPSRPREPAGEHAMDNQLAPKHTRLTLYPEIVPYRTGTPHVSHLPAISFEECGSPIGKPAVLLHGGPGGGINQVMRRYHDP